MADITITIALQDIFSELARKTTLATETEEFYANKSAEQRMLSQLHGNGDRITRDFVKEAAKEVLAAFVSRQGNVEGVPYEFDLADSGNIVFRVKQGLPALQHESSITARLTGNTKDAIICHALALLYKTDGNDEKQKEYALKAETLFTEIYGDLHRLHD